MKVNWPTGVIEVLKMDMELVQTEPFEIYNLDITDFKARLHLEQESTDGMPYLDIFSHNTSVTISGTTLARVVRIINGYTLTFENGNYAANLVGANSNLADVTNLNQVSVRSANSAGLIEVCSGDQTVGGLTPEQHDQLMQLTNYDDTNLSNSIVALQEDITKLVNVELGNWKIEGTQMIFYEIGGGELARYNLLDASGVASVESVFERQKV